MDPIGFVAASLAALEQLLEGEGRPDEGHIVYTALIGCDQRIVRARCRATHAHGGYDVLAFFEAGGRIGGTVRTGVTLPEGGMIKLQLARLWLGPQGSAVMVPRGVGQRHGHYAAEGGRIVQRAGWPAADLERGTRHAERRLAELTAEIMAAAATAHLA